MRQFRVSRGQEQIDTAREEVARDMGW